MLKPARSNQLIQVASQLSSGSPHLHNQGALLYNLGTLLNNKGYP